MWTGTIVDEEDTQLILTYILVRDQVLQLTVLYSQIFMHVSVAFAGVGLISHVGGTIRMHEPQILVSRNFLPVINIGSENLAQFVFSIPPKSLVSQGSKDFLAHPPSRGRPPPHPKLSGPKSLGLGSFFFLITCNIHIEPFLRDLFAKASVFP